MKSLNRRDLLTAMLVSPALALFGRKQARAEEIQEELTQPKATPKQTQTTEDTKNIDPNKSHLMHWVNPTLSSSLPAIRAEFYEAGVLIKNNCTKLTGSEDALRYDNADAYARPWAGLVVQLGAILARYPANFLASFFTNSKQMQSRFATMFTCYTITAEVKYARNPILSVLRDIVKEELDRDPIKYQNDPRNIPLRISLKNLIKRRQGLNSNKEVINSSSKQKIKLERSAIDLLIFGLSLVLGLQVNASAGRAIAGVPGTALILRDVLGKEIRKGTRFDELGKLKDRTRTEMITWPSLFIFNGILQNIVHASLPKLFPNDKLAQEHFVELMGNLAQAGVYCTAKAPAQAYLEKVSELSDKDLWQIIDWYIS